MGRVLGDYPVLAGYCTTWHYHLNMRICHVTVFDARHCGITHGRHLPTLSFAGVGRWQSTAGRFNQSSDTAYSDVYVLTVEAITLCDTLLVL